MVRPTHTPEADTTLPTSGGVDRPSSVAAIGLVLALVAPIIYTLILDPYLFGEDFDPTSRALVGYVVMWCLAGAVLAFTIFGERRPLSTIGFRPLSLPLVAVAVGAGVTLSLLVPLLSVVVDAVFGAGPSDVMDLATQTPIWVLTAGVVTAGVTEEILFRGYAIERLIAHTGRPWVSGLTSLAVFVAIHLPTKSVAHVLGLVLPLGLALTALYLWKRNLTLVIVVHLLVNAPMIILGNAA